MFLSECKWMHVCGHSCGVQRTVCRSQLSASMCGFWKSNSGCQTWRQVPLPNEPFCLPTSLPGLKDPVIMIGVKSPCKYSHDKREK